MASAPLRRDSQKNAVKLPAVVAQNLGCGGNGILAVEGQVFLALGLGENINANDDENGTRARDVDKNNNEKC